MPNGNPATSLSEIRFRHHAFFFSTSAGVRAAANFFMKNLLFAILCCTLCFEAAAQSPRTEKEVVQLTKKYATKCKAYFFPPHKRIKELSLSDLPEEKLNDIEKELSNEYARVCVCNWIPVYYLVSDDEGRIGICDLNGVQYVAPLEGRLRCPTSNTIGIDRLGDKEWEELTALVIKGAQMGKRVSVGMGSFCVVLNRKKPEVVIPYGKYDDIMSVINGLSFSFFVGKRGQSGEMLWGLCDETGEEKMACAYRSIAKEGGQFVGNHTLTMDQQRELIENKLDIVRDRRERWAGTLNAVGGALVTTATVMEQLGVGGGPQTGNADAGGEMHSGQSGSKSSHPGMSASELQSRYNGAIANIQKIRSTWAQHAGTSGEASQRSNLNSVKRNIQSIKSSAQKHGVSLKLNSLENWNP